MPQSHAQTPDKSFRVLYGFAGGRDGAGPGGALVDVNGTLYGTTSAGGGHPQCGYGHGCGTVYGLSTTRAEMVLHRFAGGSDGWNPVAGLIEVERHALWHNTVRRRIWLRGELRVRYHLCNHQRRSRECKIFFWELRKRSPAFCWLDQS